MDKVTSGTSVQIDLNCDVGEWSGIDIPNNDRALLTCITSANIACGGHAGDERSMQVTVRFAADHGVAIGAHPGFADRAGFGRREISATSQEIENLVTSQVELLRDVARNERTIVRHVKPHGALYNLSARDASVADAVARAVVRIDSDLILFGLSGSELIAAGRAAGLNVACEVFADRAYALDGSLVSRRKPGAVIDDPGIVLQRAVRLVVDGSVLAESGETLHLVADTICVHGDTSGAPELVRQLRAGLRDAGVSVRSIDGP